MHFFCLRCLLCDCVLHRSLLDGSAAAQILEGLTEEELLLGGAAWPCMWLLLKPSRKGPRYQTPQHPICVPLRIDNVSRSPLPSRKCLFTFLCLRHNIPVHVSNIGLKSIRLCSPSLPCDCLCTLETLMRNLLVLFRLCRTTW